MNNLLVNLILNPALSERNLLSYDFYFKRKYIKNISSGS